MSTQPESEHQAFESAVAAKTGVSHIPRSSNHDGYARPRDEMMWRGWVLRKEIDNLAQKRSPQ